MSSIQSNPDQTRQQSPPTNDIGEDADSSATTPDEPSDTDVSLDTVFDVLRNQRRRLVMEAIEERDGSTTLSELAEHIGGIENDKPPRALNAQERKRVYVGLYQCHLPKMDDAGAIAFEKNRGTVERGPKAEAFHEYLDRDFGPETRWSMYYGAIAGAGIASIVGGTFLFGGVEAGIVLVALSFVLALAGYQWTRREE